MKSSHATQNVGVTQVGDQIWLVTFMHHDLKYFDDEPCRAEPIENPFGPNVFPMCSEYERGTGSGP
jgi:putative transposase